MTGYHVGAVVTALLGILVVQRYGWEWMFVIGALPAIVLVPLMWKYLPESRSFLRAKAGLSSASSTRKPSRNPVGTLFHHGFGRSTIALSDEKGAGGPGRPASLPQWGGATLLSSHAGRPTTRP